MDITNHLEAINKDNDSVRIAIYADLSTQIVLAHVTKKVTGQEHLDKMCKQAAAAFENPLLSLVEHPDEAIAMRDDGVLVAIRRGEGSENAICLFCDYGIDIDGVLQTVNQVLSKTGAA